MSERHRGIVDSIMAGFQNAQRERWKSLGRPQPEGNHRQRYRRKRMQEYRRELKESDWEQIVKRKYAL